VLRTKYGFTSLPQAIERCYGPGATVCFSLALLFRLWNEVWSNSVVVASFYGPVHSSHWWLAVLLSTAIPAVYVMMGGMRASLFSDQLQAFLGVLFLFIILGLIGDKMPGGLNAVWTYEPPGGWLDGGSTLLAASLLQGIISYPFHDPVLTDRAFLSRPRTMLAAFIVGGAIAATFIILFSAVGIFGCYLEGAVKNGEPAVMSKALSSAAFAFTNLVRL
jgi:Na+/proline symporter